jgi:hypothetical protein
LSQKQELARFGHPEGLTVSREVDLELLGELGDLVDRAEGLIAMPTFPKRLFTKRIVSCAINAVSC